jgi:lipoprotein-anchoring transpeptidase ErfK/SrfK
MIHPRSPGADSAAAARRRVLAGTGPGAARSASGGALDLSLPGHERVWIGEQTDSLAVTTIQVWLDHVDFSPGVIDGRWGKNTAKALYWFQEAYGLTPTGRLDAATIQTLERLAGDWDPVMRYAVTDADLKGPFTPLPEDVYEKAKLSCLCYSSPAEALSERFHTTPEVIASLNRGTNLDGLTAGTELIVPNVAAGPRATAAADSVVRIVVSKKGFYAHAVDAAGNIVFHFPTTVGSKYDPSPDGNLRVTGIAFDPPFHYQPKLFADVPDTEPEAHLPAGPNSPVGVVWMQLSKENYGIHGTATPQTIGYESSHGCIRLTNWDAMLLARHVKPGVRVEFTNADQAAATGNGAAGGR